jgi:hypothetical protein
VWAGVGAIGSTFLTLFTKLPDATTDLSPWNHWPMPTVVKEVGSELDGGPVSVTVESVVAPERRADSVKAIRQYERVRRDGASQWGIFHDVEAGDRYLEIFPCEFVGRAPASTRAGETSGPRAGALRSYVSDPQVRHLIFTPSKKSI